MHDIYIEVFEGIGREEQLVMAKEIGYTGFFSGPDYASNTQVLSEFRKQGDALGLKYETIHASIPGSSDIWYEGKAGDDYIEVLLREIDNCVTFNVPILIVHTQTDLRTGTTFELGAKRYERVVAKAKEKGIILAMENVDDEAYFYKMMEIYNEPHVRFCYDSGHEACVTPGAHFLADFGDRLICTHFHDNDTTSDQHKLPFDGAVDFERIAKDLKACGYKGNLTFELRYSDAYAQKYSKREFLEECYARALRFREMIQK